MAKSAPYKQYTRNQRRAVLETDFSHGMMSTNGFVDEGYVKSLVNFTYEKDNGVLIPRPGIRPYQLIFPDMAFELEEGSPLLSDSLAIKDVKECVENGKSYYQIVLGMADSEHDTKGPLIFVTSERATRFSTIDVTEDYTYDIRYSSSVYSELATAYYYTSDLPVIHNIPLVADPIRRTEFPVGTFAFGNSYYFFGEDDHGVAKLFQTYFDDTAVPKRYQYKEVTPKKLRVSEAVTYGYNMLAGADAYVFEDQYTASVFEFEGILPYDPSSGKLMMTPKKNQYVKFRAYFNVDYTIPTKSKYDVVWEWRETTSADWTLIQRTTEVIDQATELICTFQPPAADMMIRVSVYPYVDNDGHTSSTVYDTVEKAMVVGFDFNAENYGAASAVEQEVYDLSTATGMEAWNGRIVLWGLPKDPTILFISDYNEPSYFPYPNNITIFDEPIVYALEFMDSLAVFTTNKLYQVTLEDDGNSWKTEILQSHLSINAWDKHLVQTVRNMLYFKSGNYYYMMVPKAQSQTGELTLAPITTPITSFFDNFAVNVQNILRETYDYLGDYELITYYNFLDYEDIHNLYLYKFDNSDSLLHFDVIYNTVDRTWKVWVFESARIIFPFKHNATETGLLATTSLINAVSVDEPEHGDPRRVIQIFTWDKLAVRGEYLPNNVSILYDPDEASIQSEEQRLIIPSGVAHVDENGVVIFGDPYADAVDTTVYLLSVEGYYSGFNVNDIASTLRTVYNSDEEYFTFRNFQFLDTGYREDEIQAKKRYRELQIQVNNLDKKNLQFGMEFILDGAPRKLFYKYDVTQIIDEFDPEYGIVYIDSTPFLEVDLDDIDVTNQWTIDQSLIPDVTLWKVRVAISGKGAAPRLKLLSRNEKRFELLGVNWISRVMNMR